MLDRVAGSSLAIATGLVSANVLPQQAIAIDGNEFGMYQDTEFKIQFKVPSAWKQSVQELPDRRKIVLFADENGVPKMFVAYTPIRDDFTSLGSFGSVDTVASQTILPKGGKGSLMGGEEEIESSMLSAVAKNNAYIFDYVIKTEQIPKTHYRSLWTLAAKNGNAGANLVTLTLQTEEAKYDGVKTVFDDVINSFGKIPK